MEKAIGAAVATGLSRCGRLGLPGIQKAVQMPSSGSPERAMSKVQLADRLCGKAQVPALGSEHGGCARGGRHRLTDHFLVMTMMMMAMIMMATIAFICIS